MMFCSIKDDEVSKHVDAYVRRCGDFLFPENYEGHTHEWTFLSTGIHVCKFCGKPHVCFRGHCPEVQNDSGHRVCSISGCITKMFNPCNERGVWERACLYHHQSGGGSKKHHHHHQQQQSYDSFDEDNYHYYHGGDDDNGGTTAACANNNSNNTEEDDESSSSMHEPQQQHPHNDALDNSSNHHHHHHHHHHHNHNNNHHHNNNNNKAHQHISGIITSAYKRENTLQPSEKQEHLRSVVKEVVCELLNSKKTMYCFAEEDRRYSTKACVALGRLVREMAVRKPYAKPNMIDIETFLSFTMSRVRDRRSVREARKHLPEVIHKCVTSIVMIIMHHGWSRSQRQLQNPARAREFICSMLYLMRTGVTFQNRAMLCREELLNDLLPLQVFLPKIFHIRAKCITEGENIIKLDIRRFPLK